MNRDPIPAHRERYRQDPAAFIKDYEFTEEESSAAVSVDWFLGCYRWRDSRS